LPPGPERLPFREQALVVGHRAVPQAKAAGGPVEVQPLGGVTDGRQLWFKPTSADAWLEIPFTTEKEITAELWVKLTHSWDYGTYRVKLDGRDLGTFDLLSPNVAPTSHKLGFHTLPAGAHTLRFECTGKADKSKGYFFGLDALTARIPVYARPASKDLRELQVPAK
jgi:hypothetical protein